MAALTTMRAFEPNQATFNYFFSLILYTKYIQSQQISKTSGTKNESKEL